METITINVNDVKKELYKTKVNATFSHYTSGNLYYTVELSDGTYQFPISTIEKGTLVSIETMVNSKIIELEKKIMKLNPDEINLVANVEKNEDPNIAEIKNEINTLNKELEKMSTLSADLGTTNFYDEIKASELNRWIVKAIENNSFIKIG